MGTANARISNSFFASQHNGNHASDAQNMMHPDRRMTPRKSLKQPMNAV
jgi:hypothetical protein